MYLQIINSHFEGQMLLYPSYLINNDIVFFDCGLIAVIEIVDKSIHDSVKEFYDKQWWY